MWRPGGRQCQGVACVRDTVSQEVVGGAMRTRLQRKLETRLGRACEATVKLWLFLVERWRTVGLRRRQHIESPGPREARPVPQASSLGVVPGRSPVRKSDTPTTWLTWGL